MSAFLATHQVLESLTPSAEVILPREVNAAAASELRSAAIEQRRVGPWLLESLVAEGSLSSVFRARAAASQGRISSTAQYVVKMLVESWQEDSAAIASIRQEARVGQSVSHRHVAPVLSVHVHRAPFYVVLPWLEGANVKCHLSRCGRFEPAFALWIARQAAEALEALHTAGYTHNDVNPSNLFLASNGHVTLLDMSCSRRLNDAMELTEPALAENTILGTPMYLAPEVFNGKHADARSDLYGLGMTLFEMLAGQLPPMPHKVANLVAFKREATFPNVRNYAPDVPLSVAHFVQESTAHEPLRRPQTAREMIDRFMRLEIATLRQRVPS
jgi:serine/threonine protein kinase